MPVKVLVSSINLENQSPFNLAIELESEPNSKEECTFTGNGLNVSITSDNKKKESLQIKWFNTLLSYAENIRKLLKLLLFLLLLIFPN